MEVLVNFNCIVILNRFRRRRSLLFGTVNHQGTPESGSPVLVQRLSMELRPFQNIRITLLLLAVRLRICFLIAHRLSSLQK